MKVQSKIGDNSRVLKYFAFLCTVHYCTQDLFSQEGSMALLCSPPSGQHFTLNSFMSGTYVLRGGSGSWIHHSLLGGGEGCPQRQLPHSPWVGPFKVSLSSSAESPAVTTPSLEAQRPPEHSLGDYCGEGGCQGLVFKVFTQEGINLICNTNSLAGQHFCSKSFH